MLIYAIRYFRVPYLISGIFRHFRYVKWKILHFFAIDRDISGYIACSYIARYIYLYSQQEMVIEDLWPFGERGGEEKTPYSSIHFGSKKRFKTLYFVKYCQLLRRCFFCAWFWKQSHSDQFAFHAWLVYV